MDLDFDTPTTGTTCLENEVLFLSVHSLHELLLDLDVEMSKSKLKNKHSESVDILTIE